MITNRRPLDVKDFLDILRRRKWVIVFPTLLVGVATFFITRSLPDLYRSETLILIEEQKVPEAFVRPTVQTDLAVRMQTLKQQIFSRTRLQVIIEKFSLLQSGGTESIDAVVDKLRNKDIEIELVPRRDRRGVAGFKIYFTASTPPLAQNVLREITGAGQDSLKDRFHVWEYHGPIEAEDFEALPVGLQQMMITEFAANPGLRVVGRSQIRELIAKQDLGASGRVDDNTAARIGRLAGARFMVFGSFVDLYGEMRLDIRVINTETSEIVRTDNVSDDRENLYSMVTSLAISVTENLDLPALPHAIREEREAREVPSEAIQYYSRAIMYADRGNTERAAELYSRALDILPEYTEAEEGLQQLRQS
ncbi:MAG: hypothetical protein IH787_08390 [Nitrospirae bacterium]|nr:hypothetical protein [Nitrospirota bacterium]